MKKKVKRGIAINKTSIWLISLLTYFVACDKQNLLTESKQIPVQFMAYSADETYTRVTGSKWDNGDEVGLFAVKADQELKSENIVEDNTNMAYKTSGNGRFFPSDNNNMYYPTDGSAMDIIGYYPYSSSVSNYEYPIDIEAQTEVLYSNNLKGISEKNSSNNVLYFKRVLSKVVVNISPKESDKSIAGITSTILGANTKGTLALADGKLSVDTGSKKDFIVELTGTDTQKQIIAFLLPTETEGEVKIRFSFPNGKTYTWAVPHALSVGKEYSYNIKLDGLGSIEVVESSYMEIPIYKGGVEAPNSKLAMHMVTNKSWLNSSYTTNGTDANRNFTVLFDTKNRIPYWVAYPMHPVYFGSASRTNAWGYDPKIAENLQPNLTKSWTAGDLDRGHVLASSDRNSSREINRTTFYYTNMVPQNNKMNSGRWNDLEIEVRQWANDVTKYDTLYVVTGAVLPKAPKEITYTTDNDGIPSAVPEYMYKALLKKHKQSGEYTSIVFKMTNDASAVRTAMSVAELEEETGFTFFNSLPQAQAAEVKQNKNTSPHWN